jgi:hypothetical protein
MYGFEVLIAVIMNSTIFWDITTWRYSATSPLTFQKNLLTPSHKVFHAIVFQAEISAITAFARVCIERNYTRQKI